MKAYICALLLCVACSSPSEPPPTSGITTPVVYQLRSISDTLLPYPVDSVEGYGLVVVSQGAITLRTDQFFTSVFVYRWEMQGKPDSLTETLWGEWAVQGQLLTLNAPTYGLYYEGPADSLVIHWVERVFRYERE